MKNAEIIKQILEQINYLKQEKQKIEVELEAAKNYLNVLQGNYSRAEINSEPKGNQTLQAREKMRKAQQERQERERNLRLQAISQYLSEHDEAVTQEIASFLKLKENATKRYLRLAEKMGDIKEVRIGVWRLNAIDETEIPF